MCPILKKKTSVTATKYPSSLSMNNNISWSVTQSKLEIQQTAKENKPYKTR